MKNIITKIIPSESSGLRIDVILAKQFPEFSRNYFSDLIKKGNVTINGLKIKPSSKPKTDDELKIVFEEKENDIGLAPESIPLDIIFEDQNTIVVNKQPGLVVHPAAGNHHGTLVNALIHHFPNITEAVVEKGNSISESRPGLVHRLDKDTSGVIIIAKNARAMHSFSRQIQNRSVQKIYLALCYGWPHHLSGTLINYLGRSPKNRKTVAEVGENKGKRAVSEYKVIKRLQDNQGNKISIIQFDIKTGRTHQIRIQTKILGHPVIGDSIYGTSGSQKLSKLYDVQRQLLHASSLSISLLGDKKQRTFEAKTPSDFLKLLKHFKET